MLLDAFADLVSATGSMNEKDFIERRLQARTGDGVRVGPSLPLLSPGTTSPLETSLSFEHKHTNTITCVPTQ